MPVRFRKPRGAGAAAAICVGLCLASGASTGRSQQPPSGATPPTAVPAKPEVSASTPDQAYGQLLRTPIDTFVPGGGIVNTKINIPALDDPAAVQRGMMAFSAFNCVGCHMGNGGGGMGPALSEGNFIYGDRPENIYLTIVQGRPNGMPAWGAVLPNATVWDLVAYIRNLSSAPRPEWGQTISPQSPQIEQVPVEFSQTPTPWQQTEPFKNGQKP